MPQIDKSQLRFPTPPKRKKRRRRGDSPQHVAFLRDQECVVTNADRIRRGLPAHPVIAREVHHLYVTAPYDGGRCMGRKSRDMFALPICAAWHRTRVSSVTQHHNRGGNELEWFAGFGITDPVEMALAFARRSPDPEIVEAVEWFIAQANQKVFQ